MTKFVKLSNLAHVAALLVLIGLCFAWEPSDDTSRVYGEDDKLDFTPSDYDPFKGSKPCLPKSSEVIEMTAHAYSDWFLCPDTYEFYVPKDKYEELLSCFADAELHRHVPRVYETECGTIRIAHKGGLPIRICIFSGERPDFLFSLHGVRCRVPEAKMKDRPGVDGLIRDIFQKQTGYNISAPNRHRKQGLLP